MKHLAWTAFLILLLPAALAGSVAEDRAALEDLYQSTNGDSWTDNTNWASSAPLGDWYGIDTDTNGRVTRIDLFENNLQGQLPASIGDLDAATYINIKQNSITGELPDTIGNLASIQELYLSGTNDHNPPTKLTHDQHQGKSDQSGNSFTGTIPRSIGQLTTLTHLELSGTDIQDVVPAEIGNLENLIYLAMSWNEGLTGPLPEELGNLQNLNWMFFRASGLTGELPESMSTMKSLRRIHFGNGNTLTGELPDLSDLKLLRYVNFDGNDLTGEWPQYWNNGDFNLISLRASWNDLGGELHGFENLTNLVSFSVGGNYKISGTINGAEGLCGIKIFAVGWNNLSGEIPDLSCWTRARTLYFNGNDFTGQLPAGLANIDAPSSNSNLNFANNRLTGPVPAEWADMNINRFGWIHVSNNELSGPINPDILDLGVGDYTATNNKFVFADLIPTIQQDPDFEYAPQKPFGEKRSATGEEGQTFTISFDEPTHPDNAYQWYKDASAISGATSKGLTIESMSSADEATYTLQVTNDNAPDLTLTSEPLTLSLGAAYQEDPAVCGDGVREDPEACDDGNSRDDDWCTNSCEINTRAHSGFSFVDQELDYTQHDTTKDLQVRVDDTAIYDTGYYSIDGGKNWQQFSLAGNNPRNNWLIGSAQANIPFTYDELNTSAQKLVATYSCTWSNGWTCHDSTWQLKAFSAAYSTAPECGNGIIEQGEACDGSNITTTCTEQGYDGGSISCTDSCELDTSSCTQEEGTLTATTLPATRITTDSAQLNMELTDWGVRDRGEPWLEWREQGTTEWTATERREVSYDAPWMHSDQISGLEPATTYEVRARAFTWETTDAGEILEFTTDAVIGTQETDRAALMALYESTNGDGWTDNTGWGTAADTMGSWHGVTTNQDGRVTRLDLHTNNLQGTIPPEIGDLPELQYLQLEANKLHGDLPPEIGNLRNLVWLFLAGRPDVEIRWKTGGYHPGKVIDVSNNFTGTLPPEFGNLESLEVLRLERQGEMHGPLPAELGNLKNLRGLLLYGRYRDYESGFTGTLPPEMGNLENLVVLQIGRNALEGPIPAEWGNMREMRSLWFGGTKITSFPESLKNMKDLRWFGADRAHLDMPFPHFMFEGNQQKMHTFVFGWPRNGGFTGSIENINFSKAPRVSHFGVTGNTKLTGGLPRTLALINPEIYNTAWTDRGGPGKSFPTTEGVSGTIPPGDYTQWNNLRNFRVNTNHLSGPIPVSLGTVDADRIKYFQENNFVFADIIPALEEHNRVGASGEFGYAPQRRFGQEASHSVAASASITLDDFSTDVTHPDNAYQWHKDGSAISGATSRELTISDASSGDAGTYHLEVHNSRAPALTLESERIELSVS